MDKDCFFSEVSVGLLFRNLEMMSYSAVLGRLRSFLSLTIS